MDKKTHLSSYPEFASNFLRYVQNLKRLNIPLDKWLIVSDYCIGNPCKINTIAFTILPTALIKDFCDMGHLLKVDIKEKKSISSQDIQILKNIYIFNIAITFPKDLDNINFEEIKEYSFTQRHHSSYNKLYNYLCQKQYNKNLIRNIWLTAFYISEVFEYLTIKYSVKYIDWLSDRDDMINNHLDSLIYCLTVQFTRDLIHKRRHLNLRFLKYDTPDYSQLIDTFIRFPDYIAGLISSINFDNWTVFSKKHFNLCDILIKNENIFILGVNKTGNVYRYIYFKKGKVSILPQSETNDITPVPDVVY